MANGRVPLRALLSAGLWAAGFCVLPARAAQDAVSVATTAAGIVVRSPRWQATVSPANGGRIVSFLLDGAELTWLSVDGHGGLIEETHTADYAFEVVEARATPQGAVVRLSADAGPLRVAKKYGFSQDSPLVAVELTFENRSSHRLGGTWAPAVRNLATPSGGASGQELFCMDRGFGTEVMPAGLFLARPDAPGPLRWIAVSDPAARRTLGFAVLSGGCRPIPPLRTPEGLLVTGWSCPTVPAGRRVTVRALVAPLDGFATLAELNEQFACDSVPVPRAGPPAAQFALVPFAADMNEVSVTTRAYDSEGREVGLCDPLLFHGARPFRPAYGQIAWQAADAPAWLVHEVYGREAKLGQFAVPVGRGQGAPPLSPAASAPESEPIEGTTVPVPGSLIPVGVEAARRGFVVWQFDGIPARAEAGLLELAIARGQQRTAFLGVRALANVKDLGFAVTAAPAENGVTPLPPAAVATWRVLDEVDGSAQMVPLRELDLAAGEVAWLGLTVDTTGLAAGRHSAHLTAGAEGKSLRLPVVLDVFEAGALDADAFPVWYLPGCTDATLADSAQAKLSACGVSGLTVPLPSGDTALAASEGTQAERRGWAFLAFCSGAGAHPPAGTFPTRLALAHPRPVWLLDAGRAAPGAARAAADAGCQPALLCERLATLSPEMLPGSNRPSALLVSDGCEPGTVQQMLATTMLGGQETVWLHLDLRGADWRQAATEVRSAFWAAAWQGLAGAAITGPDPFREVDRHSPVWHIVRDARQEVALWRTVRRRAEAAVGRGEADALGTFAMAEGTVGTAEGHDLVLRPERRPFGKVLRVGGRPDAEGPALNAFENVHHRLLGLASGLPATGPDAPEPGQVYWDGIPLLKDGRVRWAIVVSDGEDVWKRAMALQAAMSDAGGSTVPVSRSFPDLQAGSLLLVWVVGGPVVGSQWPESVRAHLDRPGTASLTIVQPDGGPPVAILSEAADLAALARGFRRTPDAYPTARHVR